MWQELIAPKFLVIYLFLGSAIYIQFRGRERLRFTRQLQQAGHIRGSAKHNDLAFNTFFKRGWTRFYLKWYDDFLPSACDLCPRTVELVRSIPTVNAALFTHMPPRSRLGAHRDPFAGSLRYHLGLITPNSANCRIFIDGTPYAWKDGQDVLFDETYIHSVRNDTDESRLILFCDVTRPLRTSFVRWLNQLVTRYVVKISATQNVDAEKVGFLNHLSGLVQRYGQLMERFKAANQPLYQISKWLFIAGLLYLIFVILL